MRNFLSDKEEADVKRVMKIVTVLLICAVFGGIIVLAATFDLLALDDIIEFLPFDDALEEFIEKRRRRKRKNKM